MKETDYFAGDEARNYDSSHSDMFRPEKINPCVELLSEYAGSEGALEFGIGTGRVAIPLRKKGIPVSGIDLSQDMLKMFYAKRESRNIPVFPGDFSSARAEGKFSLVYLIFNTIMNLTTQESQTACFINAARHLTVGGHFIIKVMVPELRRLPPGDRIRSIAGETNRWGFDEYDTVSQKLVSHHLTKGPGGWEESDIPFRYVWPSELDLMARIAGMVPAARWEDWSKRPFTAESRSHVSVWRIP